MLGSVPNVPGHLVADLHQAEDLGGVRRSLRVAKVADLLDTEPSQIRKLLKAGELDGHRIGKRGLRVYVDSIEAYQQRNQVGAAAAPPTSLSRPHHKRGPSAAARAALASLRVAGIFD